MASSAVFGPEMFPVGVGIYEAGVTTDKISTGLHIQADLVEGNFKDATIRGSATGIDYLIG